MELFLLIGDYVQTHPLGIALSIVASIALGFIWHGPLFGKTWMKYNKMTPPKKKDMKFSMMIPGLVMSVIMVFVQASVIGWVLQELPSMSYALIVAFMIWLPFIALTLANIYVWSAKPKGLIFLDAGYSLVSMMATAAILYATM